MVSWARQREILVYHLERRGIRDPRILEAFRRVPRHLFVPEPFREVAYMDRALPIGFRQTISQPYTIARMLQMLGVDPGRKILEIGTGSGFLTALLLYLGMEVVSLERMEPLLVRAQQNLESAGFSPEKYPVHLILADGSMGWYGFAPYDGIICSASVPRIPVAWKFQLRFGGRIVSPVASGESDVMYVVWREGPAVFRETPQGRFLFVRLQEGIERWIRS